jgi:hypothetical protein
MQGRLKLLTEALQGGGMKTETHSSIL